MVARRLPDAARNVVEAIHSATGGNPLLVEELLREVAAGGEGSGHDMISRVEEASVPLLGERVARRIAPAGERAPGLAAAAAVMGDSASLESIAALTGLTLDGAGSVAHRLRRMEVLSSEDPVTFVHPLVRRSVYDALPQQERRRLHARAAELLGERGADAQAVAAHLEVLSPAASPAAARGLVAAGDAALAAGAPDEALHWLRRALAEEAPEPPRASVLAKLGSAELMASEPASVSHLHEAFELTTEPRARTQVAVELAEAHLLAGDWGPAAQVARAARSALEGSGSELMAELAAIQALIKAYTPQLVGELDAERAAFAELTGGDSRSARSLAAVLAAVAAHRGEVARSRQLISRALEHDATLSGGSAATAAGAHLLIALTEVEDYALTEVEDYERALDISHEMSAVARRRGRLNVVMVALDHRGWVQNRKGDLAAAEADLRTGTELAATTQSPTAAASRVFYCQDALLERPELEDLVEQTLAVELHEGLAQTWIGAAFLAARGRLRLERRDRAGAVADLRASNEMHVALRMGPAVSPSRSGLALALPASERDEAVALVDEEVRLAQDTGLARAQGVALRAAGLLADDGTGIESLSESVSRLEGSGASLDHARSLVELGAALRRAQRVSDARETLTAGLAQAEACGAERLARRTREELAASGIRRARVAVGGPMSLTASERRVAELASGGATNPEIAQDLFVTVKTVETHLSSAYAKLGIAGTGARERLPGALENPVGA